MRNGRPIATQREAASGNVVEARKLATDALTTELNQRKEYSPDAFCLFPQRFRLLTEQTPSRSTRRPCRSRRSLPEESSQKARRFCPLFLL